MKMKELFFLLTYSLKSLLVDDIGDVFVSLKKAKTWSFIFYATFFISAYYQQYALTWVALSLIFVVYIIRKHKEPEYNIAVKERAFLKGDEEKICQYYERYKREAYFSTSQRKSKTYEDYKQEETQKILEKKHQQQQRMIIQEDSD